MMRWKKIIISDLYKKRVYYVILLLRFWRLRYGPICPLGLGPATKFGTTIRT